MLLAGLGLLLGGLWLWLPGRENPLGNHPVLRRWASLHREGPPAAYVYAIAIVVAMALPTGLMLRASTRLYSAGVLETQHAWDDFANSCITTLLGASLVVMCLAILVQLGTINRFALPGLLVSGLALLPGLLVVGSAAMLALASGLSSATG